MTAENEVWSLLPSIGLEELNEAAALETRFDHKYIVPPDAVDGVVGRLAEQLRILEIDGLRRFDYETFSFDTEHLDAYRAAATSRPKRYKVRTRTYRDSGVTMLEVKVRDARDRTVKHRRPYGYEQRDHLTDAGRQFVAAIIGDEANLLRPVLVGRYLRRTVLLPEAGIRATIDSVFRCHDLVCGGRAHLPNALIVETKSTGKPGRLDRLLWETGYRPTRISKYGTGLAVARGGLPANKWHRTILRHMAISDGSNRAPSDGPVHSQARALAWP